MLIFCLTIFNLISENPSSLNHSSTSDAGFSSNSDNSSTDIDLPAPNSIASRIVESSGLDKFGHLLNLRLGIKSEGECGEVIFLVPEVSERDISIPATILLEINEASVGKEKSGD